MKNTIKRFKEKINKFLSFNNKKNVPRLLDLVREMEQMLDVSEKQPVIFEQSPCSQFDLLALAQGAKVLANQAQSLVPQENVPKIQNFLLKSVSIQYRLESVNGGADPLSVQSITVNSLKRLAMEWIECQEILDSKALSDNEIYQLQVASQYPEFVDLMTQNDQLVGKFFRWIIRDKNEARIFIEYPALSEKITRSNLSGRIGRLGGEKLKIQKVCNSEGLLEKIVTLPFEGTDRNILDGDATIVFRGNYQLTVDEVFKVFKDKNIQVGNLEYLALGITNWNCHKWGFWNAESHNYEIINLNHRQWWQQLPIFEVISIEEAQERYRQPLDGKSWCLAASATRGSASLDFENTHAFLEVAIPFGDGSYAVYDFGKFAKKYPATFFEGLSIFCHNLKATVSYPDENVFYTHRQQTFHAFVVNEDQGKTAMELVKADLIKGMSGHFVYQIESDNCAKWVHEVLESSIGVEHVPDMFCMHLLDTEPQGPVALIFNGIKKLPHCMQTKVLTFCHLFLGATKKTWIIENGMYVCKSLTRHEFWETGIVYLPALLHKKVEENAFENLVELSSQVVRLCYSVFKKFFALMSKEKTVLQNEFHQDDCLFQSGMYFSHFCLFLRCLQSG